MRAGWSSQMKHFTRRLVLFFLLLTLSAQVGLAGNTGSRVSPEKSPIEGSSPETSSAEIENPPFKSMPAEEALLGKDTFPGEVLLVIFDYLSDDLDWAHFSEANRYLAEKSVLSNELDRRKWREPLKAHYLGVYKDLKNDTDQSEKFFDTFFTSTRRLNDVKLEQIAEILIKQGLLNQIHAQLKKLNKKDADTRGCSFDTLTAGFGAFVGGIFIPGLVVGVPVQIFGLAGLDTGIVVGTTAGIMIGSGVGCAAVVPSIGRVAWRHYALTKPIEQKLEAQQELENKMKQYAQELHQKSVANLEVLREDPLFLDIFSIDTTESESTKKIELMRSSYTVQMLDESTKLGSSMINSYSIQNLDERDQIKVIGEKDVIEEIEEI
jgi:hypothetical protein